MSKGMIVEAEDLVKRFGAFRALRGLSFKMPRSVTGFIGPNGAGKTTTIRILLGLIKPDKGYASVLGHDCWKNSLQVRKSVGFLQEKPAFYEQMTGLEYLEVVARLKNLQDPRFEAKNALDLVDLAGDDQTRKIKGYSAGMRQKLGLAQSLLGDPKLVVLDEPTSNLDPLGRIRLLEIIQRIRRDSGTSFLISSHVLSELERVCDYVILIHEGQSIKTGYLGQIFQDFQHWTFKIDVKPIQPLADLMKSIEYVQKIWIENSSLYVMTESAERLRKDIPKLVIEANVSLEGMRIEDRSLESLFKSSIRGK